MLKEKFGKNAVLKVCSIFRSLSMERLCLYPNTLSTLRELKRRGCKLYLLSNAQSAFTRPELDILGLTDFFDDIFISSEHQIMKPDPKFLKELLQKHDLSPDDTAMVGNDVLSDMVIADLCGIRGILLNTAKQPVKAIQDTIVAAGIKNPKNIIVIRSGNIAELTAPPHQSIK